MHGTDPNHSNESIGGCACGCHEDLDVFAALIIHVMRGAADEVQENPVALAAGVGLIAAELAFRHPEWMQAHLQRSYSRTGMRDMPAAEWRHHEKLLDQLVAAMPIAAEHEQERTP